jgi:hypothetical protein
MYQELMCQAIIVILSTTFRPMKILCSPDQGKGCKHAFPPHHIHCNGADQKLLSRAIMFDVDIQHKICTLDCIVFQSSCRLRLRMVID